MPHIFSFLPQLFFLSPLAATLLRISAAIVFARYALGTYSRRAELAQVDVMIVGRGMWIPVLSALGTGAVALCLFFGFYTQLAAIFGAIAALKMVIWKKRYPMFVPLSRTASALLLVICLTLVVTGAGAFAVDLPL